MEFDKNKIDQKLLFMDTCLNKLKKLRAFDKDVFIEDFTKVDSAKYLLQVSIEAMLDISSHLIASKFVNTHKRVCALEKLG